MTKNDFFNALKCCANDTNNCGACPLFELEKCRTELARIAIDFFESQTAELERLKNISFEDVYSAVIRACRKNLCAGERGVAFDKALECATKIYLAQKQGGAVDV